MQTSDEVIACRGQAVRGARIEMLDLRARDLGGTRFSDVVFRRVCFSQASLEATSFERIDAIACDLRSANLTQARVLSSVFNGCDMAQIEATGIVVRDTRLQECRLAGANFAGARWTSVTITGGETAYVRMEKALLLACRFEAPRLGGCPLMRAQFKGTFFIECDLRAANLYCANLRGAVFINTDLSDACFEGADLTGAVFIDCGTDRTDWAEARG
jgi:hypothetical protein